MARKKPILRFWGVRGSIATPGSSTVKFGGNTACVELSFGEDRVVFDAGSGLRELGITLAKQANLHLTLALSHYHWDHLLGLPFFIPVFKPDTTLEIYGEAKGEGGGPKEAMERQFSSPSFPVPFSTLPSTLNFHALDEGDSFSSGEIAVKVGRLNHPNGAVCYRAQAGNRSVVYASDHEHDGAGDAKLIEFCNKADVLVYDAMYADEGYGMKKGWGHSTWQEGIRVAKAAKVKNLFLFHHDPMNDDKKLAQIEREAQKLFPNAVVAREGLAFEF